jgi:uncharacterized membrane protein YfcA
LTAGAVVAVIAAALVAGAANAIVGSGSLLTFPTLVALGYTPLVANVSNAVGLVFGTASGAAGYRRELSGQRERIVGLGAYSALGGIVGALLLLILPAGVFQAIVPALVLFAVLLVAVQPWLTQRMAARSGGRGPAVILRGSVFATGVYGGYFGAAQGVILMAALAVLIDDTLLRLNGMKNVLMTLATIGPAIIFAVHAPVAWEPAALVALGSVVGAQLGSWLGRRLSPAILRVVIICAGVAVVVKLLV